MARDPFSAEMKKGSLQLCVLALLSREPMYGYQLIKTLKEESDGYFDLKEGTLYPILYRMVDKGILKDEWLQVDNKPPRKYYTMTAKGKKHLEKVKQEFELMVAASNEILASTSDEKAGSKKGKPVKKR